MTTMLDAPTPEAPIPDEAPAPRRRRSGVLIALMVGGGILLAAVIGWVLWLAVSTAVAASALASVSLGYDSQPVTCDGAEVGTRPSIDNIEYLNPVIVLQEGMTCQLRIQVFNDSAAEVTVDSVTLLGMGPDNVLGLEPKFVNPNAQVQTMTEEGDALFELQGPIAIEAGTSTTLTAVFGYAGGAALISCSSSGWSIPAVTVSLAGASAVLTLAHPDIWFQKGAIADCTP